MLHGGNLTHYVAKQFLSQVFWSVKFSGLKMCKGNGKYEVWASTVESKEMAKRRVQIVTS